MKFPARMIFAGVSFFLGTSLLVVGGMAEIARSGDRVLTDARALYGLDSIVENAERVLGLGFAVTDLRQIDGILETVASENDDVLAAEIFDASGISLVSSDRGALGEPVPAGWLVASSEARHGGVWSVGDGTTRVVGSAIENDFGSVAGQAALIMRSPVGFGETLVELRWLSVVPEVGRWVAVPIAGGLGALVAYGLCLVLRRRTRILLDRLDGAPPTGRESDPRLAEALAAASGGFIAASDAISGARSRLAAIDGEI